jgi:hypothetical protein
MVDSQRARELRHLGKQHKKITSLAVMTKGKG